MIPGMAEAATGAKAASSLIGAVKAARGNQPQWPNMQEALLGLYAILEEWCTAAAITSAATDNEVAGRTSPEPATDMSTPFVRTNIESFAGSNVVSSSFVKVTVRDIGQLMSPTAGIKARLQPAERRSAARRGLRTLLSVYFPDILADFEEAIEGRQRFVETNRDLPKVIHSLSLEELLGVQRESRRTYVILVDVTNELADMIAEFFPIDPKSAR